MVSVKQPLIAITLGDPAGVGPETIVGAWAEARLHRQCRALVVGRPEILRRAARLLESPVKVVEIAAPEEALAGETASCEHLMPCLSAGSDDALETPPGVIDARGGQAAYDAIVLAAQLALNERVDAVTTAPLCKAALQRAGHDYPGHTELLADLCDADRFAMMLYLGPPALPRSPAGLGVVHVTLHEALRDAIAGLSVEGIVSKCHLADAAMRRLGALRPRIGVCALNPHAGEDGLFGDEEQMTIAPAVRQAREDGLSVEGPLPADTLMVAAQRGDYDAVVAMYHDQGHIALKLLGMHSAVNITLGLPIIRTSVAHGTAMDLAGTGRAETTGVVAAVGAACQLVAARDCGSAGVREYGSTGVNTP